MRVLEVREPFGVESIAFSTRADPTPGPHQLLIQLKALSLNYRDHLVVGGIGRWRPKSSRIPLSDGVGLVTAVGSFVTRFKAGDRVSPLFYPHWIDGPPTAEKMQVSLGGAGFDGLYAEYAVVDESAAVAPPAHLTDLEAATLPCAGLTAWNAVAEGVPPQDGETVVVLGTGGVALFAIQFAKLFGARVIVTSSSDSKLERARELGADGIINYRATPNWPAVLRDMTGGRGANLVVDSVGSLAESIDAVSAGGRIAFIGFVRGNTTEVDLIKLMGSSATIRAIDVGSRAMVESMNGAIESSRLRPVIDRTFGFAEGSGSFRYLTSGAHFGKVCIRV